MVSFRNRSAAVALALAVDGLARLAAAQQDNTEPRDATTHGEIVEAPKTSDGDQKDAQSSAAPAARAAEPRLHHAPAVSAKPHEPLVISAEIEHPELVRRALLVYKTAHRAGLAEVEFRRAVEGYVAAIPSADMRWPWVAYALEIEGLDGQRKPVFGSREHPHSVLVPEDLEDVREGALDERLEHRRSAFFGGGDYVDFGLDAAQVPQADGTVQEVAVRDRYIRIEAGYSYRPLRVVSEFSLRAGIVRGSSPVPVNRQLKEGETPNDRLNVGLNYGAPSVRFRLHDLVHLEGEFLTSVTEIGFSVGGGSAILIGDAYGSKLTLGFESIQVFGTRFFSRFDVVANKRLKFSPVVEATNMPHADKYGVRLLSEIGVDFGEGFGLAVRGGYQARSFNSGGPTFGGTVSYAF